MSEGKTLKIVDFTFCKTCKNKDVFEADEPCNLCLCNRVNENSVKPINYEEDK